MYVCLCNALTDRQVKEAVSNGACARPSDVHAACGCRAQCGACVKKLLQLVRGDEAGSMQGA